MWALFCSKWNTRFDTVSSRETRRGVACEGVVSTLGGHAHRAQQTAGSKLNPMPCIAPRAGRARRRGSWLPVHGAPLTHSSHSRPRGASAHSARPLSRARGVSPCRRRADWRRLRAWRCHGTSGNTPRDRGRRCAAARRTCRSERRRSRRWASGLSLFHVRRPRLVGRAPLLRAACPSLPTRGDPGAAAPSRMRAAESPLPARGWPHAFLLAIAIA
jgi:hypothetical protein